MTKKFWIHDEKDSVGVAVDDLRAGESVEGAYMRGSGGVRVTPTTDIPLGHKIALRPIATGEKVLEYAEVIGRAIQPIAAGDHVHVHNLRSLRWADASAAKDPTEAPSGAPRAGARAA